MSSGRTATSEAFAVEDAAPVKKGSSASAGVRRSYRINREMDGDLAPVALALPHSDYISIGIKSDILD